LDFYEEILAERNDEVVRYFVKRYFYDVNVESWYFYSWKSTKWNLFIH